MLKHSKNTNQGEEEEGGDIHRASIVNEQIQQKGISAAQKRVSMAKKQIQLQPKRNIRRTEAGIQSQAPDLTLHTISTMPGGEDELKEQVEALTVHKDDVIIY